MTTTITRPIPPYKLELTKFGRMLKLTASTDVALYATTGTLQELQEYYENTIVPWLDDQYEKWLEQHPGEPYPMGIYLVNGIMVVLTDSANYETWESIPNLDKYVTKLDAEKFEWHPPANPGLKKIA